MKIICVIIARSNNDIRSLARLVENVEKCTGELFNTLTKTCQHVNKLKLEQPYFYICILFDKARPSLRTFIHCYMIKTNMFVFSSHTEALVLFIIFALGARATWGEVSTLVASTDALFTFSCEGVTEEMKAAIASLTCLSAPSASRR